MTKDLPDFYKNEGYVGQMLEDSLKRKDPIHWVRVSLAYPNSSTYISFFSRGDFRPDIVEEAKNLLRRDTEYGDEGYGEAKGRLPVGWEKKILGLEGCCLAIQGTQGLVLHLGTLDIKRLAEISQGGQVENPIFDEKHRQILSRKELLVEFRGAIVDQIFNGNKYGTPSEMDPPPNDVELRKRIEDAGEVYDHYMSLPTGSLIVTKDFIFPFVFARKEHSDLRWFSSRYCGYSYRAGARIPTADSCVHLTGISKDVNTMVNPVFRANFGFDMDVVRTTSIVPAEDEKDCIEKAIESMGHFKSIWVQNPPEKIPAGITPKYNQYHWHPKKDELIQVIKNQLNIS